MTLTEAVDIPLQAIDLVSGANAEAGQADPDRLVEEIAGLYRFPGCSGRR